MSAIRVEETIRENHRSTATAEESVLNKKGAVIADIQGLGEVLCGDDEG
jgi:hypothetical protein